MRDVIAIDKTMGGEIATDKTIEIGNIIGKMTPGKDRETGEKVGINQCYTGLLVVPVPQVHWGNTRHLGWA